MDLPKYITEGCKTSYNGVSRFVIAIIVSLLVLGVTYKLVFLPLSTLSSELLSKDSADHILFLLNVSLFIASFVFVFKKTETMHEIFPNCRWHDRYTILVNNPGTTHGEALGKIENERRIEMLESRLAMQRRN